MTFTRMTAALTFALALGTAAIADDAPSRDTVIAKVGQTEITLGQMIVMQETLPDQYRALPDDVLYQAMLDQLVQQAAILEKMDAELTYRDATRLENQRRAFLGNVALDQALADVVTEETVQAAYDAQFGEGFEGAPQFRASHILVATEDEAKALLEELDGGADFAELAKAKSQGPSGTNGGDLGWFGRGMMVQPFDEAVAEMEKDEVKGPVQTQFGWHVIKLDDTRIEPAPTLDEARQQIVEDLEQEAIEKFLMAATDGLDIELMAEDIDPSVLRDMSIVE